MHKGDCYPDSTDKNEHRQTLLSKNTGWSDINEPVTIGGSSKKQYTCVELETGYCISKAPSDIVAVGTVEENKSPQPYKELDQAIDRLDSKPKKGDVYRMVDLGSDSGLCMTLSDPFYVMDVSETDGVTKITTTYSHYKNENPKYRDTDPRKCDITLNPDFEGHNYEHFVFHPDKVAFVKVDESRHYDDNKLELSNDREMYNMIVGDKIKKASVHQHGDAFLLSQDGEVSKPMDKLAAIAVLMREYELTGHCAETIMAKAASQPAFHFWTPAHTKEAHSLSFEVPEDFEEGYDETFGVAREEQPQTLQVLSDSEEPDMPEPRVGDRIRFESGADIGTKGPMELAQLAEQTGNKSLFDHGVIGSLSKTYNSSLMIDKYLPGMEKALDYIGRLLFLFYWKPEDFADLYGDNDQSGLENNLLSNFSSFGDLVLELLKKRKAFSRSVGNSY